MGPYLCHYCKSWHQSVNMVASCGEQSRRRESSLTLGGTASFLKRSSVVFVSTPRGVEMTFPRREDKGLERRQARVRPFIARFRALTRPFRN